mmetsp:Transcript_5580/g.11781  ORF Transcript_5580/g.11781 Transcript_5580/m.11781 type:complete len:215 (-) Transcript_5580:588-1232(-)
MAVITMLGSLLFIVWIERSKTVRIVRASQPIFLLFICTGVFLMGSSIIPLSIDDEIASAYACSVSCMLVPWLYAIGFALVFAALYSKTKRVMLLLQAKRIRRIKVTARDVMLPLICLLTANVLVLSLWTALSPLRFQREYTSGQDKFGRKIESYGGCLVGSGMNHVPYIATLAFSMLEHYCLPIFRHTELVRSVQSLVNRDTLAYQWPLCCRRG